MKILRYYFIFVTFLLTGSELVPAPTTPPLPLEQMTQGQDIRKIEHYRVYFLPRSRERRNLHVSPAASPLASSPDSQELTRGSLPRTPRRRANSAGPITEQYEVYQSAPVTLFERNPRIEELPSAPREEAFIRVSPIPTHEDQKPQNLDIEARASIEAQLSWWQWLKCLCSCNASRR